MTNEELYGWLKTVGLVLGALPIGLAFAYIGVVTVAMVVMAIVMILQNLFGDIFG